MNFQPYLNKKMDNNKVRILLKEDIMLDFNIVSLTENKWYIGVLDEHNSEPYYILRCDDGILRKVLASYFITEEDWRESQLNKIGINFLNFFDF